MRRKDERSILVQNLSMLNDIVRQIRPFIDDKEKLEKWFQEKKYHYLLSVLSDEPFKQQVDYIDMLRRLEKESKVYEKNFCVKGSVIKCGKQSLKENETRPFWWLVELFNSLEWADDENIFKRGKYYFFRVDADYTVLNEKKGNYKMLFSMLKHWDSIPQVDEKNQDKELQRGEKKEKQLTLGDAIYISSVLKNLVPYDDEMGKNNLDSKKYQVIDKYVFNYYLKNAKVTDSLRDCELEFIKEYERILNRCHVNTFDVMKIQEELSSLKAMSPKGYHVVLISMYISLRELVKNINDETLEMALYLKKNRLEEMNEYDESRKIFQMFKGF